MTKRKIAIVVGKPDDVRVLDLFEPLCARYDVSVLALQNDEALSSYRTQLKIKIFRELQDMPGYMRGLEDELAGSELVIILDSSRLSSFQALRASLRNQRPVLAYVSDSQPFFFSDYPNIRAIQTDIFTNASGFIATTSAVRETLMIEGVGADKITVVPPAVNTAKFIYSDALRTKFRNYIGVGTNDLLILSRDELSKPQRAQDMLMTLRVLRTTLPATFPRVKLLFAATGPMADELKYLASDHGLGKNVLFLQQNCDPFVLDLYCASDLVTTLRPQDRNIADHGKRWLLEAAATRVLPLLPAGSQTTEWLAGAGIEMAADAPTDVAKFWSILAGEREELDKRRDACAAHVREAHDAEKLVGLIEREIEIHLERSSREVVRERDLFQELYHKVEAHLAAGSLAEVFTGVEDLLLRVGERTKDRSDLLRIKGDAYLHAGNLEEATQTYADASQLDESNWRAYLGLGQLAFMSHSHEEAIKFFKKVLARDPNNYHAMLGFGGVYRRLKMFEEAVFWLGKCVELGRGDRKALFSLSQTCLESDDVAGAIGAMERAMEIVGEKESAVVMGLGQLYLRSGEVEKGRALLDKVMGTPKLPEAS